LVKNIEIPLHVSGLWIPVKGSDPLSSGSLGAGLNLSLKLVVKKYSVGGECSIYINGVRVLDPHARHICGRTGLNLSLEYASPIGLGYGYAVSASASIGYALLSGLIIEKGFIENYYRYAHEAEVIYNTGLGDVLSIYSGGLNIRIKPGAPGIGSAYQILVDNPSLLAVVLPGYEDTASMLSRISRETYEYGSKLFEALINDPCLESYFEKAEAFTRRIFDYKYVDELLGSVKNMVVGYYRKKQALIIWVEDEYVDELYSYLNGYGLETYRASVEKNPPRP